MSTSNRGCRYDEDFKRTIVTLYNTGGKTQAALCQEYGISLTALCRWIKQYSEETNRRTCHSLNELQMSVFERL